VTIDYKHKLFAVWQRSPGIYPSLSDSKRHVRNSVAIAADYFSASQEAMAIRLEELD
jgi:hypothetical protein